MLILKQLMNEESACGLAGSWLCLISIFVIFYQPALSLGQGGAECGFPLMRDQGTYTGVTVESSIGNRWVFDIEGHDSDEFLRLENTINPNEAYIFKIEVNSSGLIGPELYTEPRDQYSLLISDCGEESICADSGYISEAFIMINSGSTSVPHRKLIMPVCDDN